MNYEIGLNKLEINYKSFPNENIVLSVPQLRNNLVVVNYEKFLEELKQFAKSQNTVIFLTSLFEFESDSISMDGIVSLLIDNKGNTLFEAFSFGGGYLGDYDDLNNLYNQMKSNEKQEIEDEHDNLFEFEITQLVREGDDLEFYEFVIDIRDLFRDQEVEGIDILKKLMDDHDLVEKYMKKFHNDPNIGDNPALNNPLETFFE